jgi:hypothetical protein
MPPPGEHCDPIEEAAGRCPAPLRRLDPFQLGDSAELRPHVEKAEREARLKREAEVAAQEARIAALLGRIESGRSRIRVYPGWNDPDFKAKRTDWKEHEANLKKESMRYFEELARTEVGFKLLSELDASPHTFEIIPWDGKRNETTWSKENYREAYLRPDGTPGKGDRSTIKINASLTTFADVARGEKEQPWMTERVKYGLYHELVHAWHGSRGTLARGDHKREPMAEFQAVGLGPFASEAITENLIRQQMGKELRPDVERKTF